MKNLKYYFEKARKEGFAIPQFNFSDFSQVKGIVAKALELNSPIILGTSEGESKFVGLAEAVAMRDVLRKKTGLPIFLNLDHGKTFEYLQQAGDAGYDMIHFDGSKLPLEENIKIAKEVVKYAHKKGIVVEGEVGRIGTDGSRLYTEKFEIKESDLTKPEDAFHFLNEAKVDVLAISVGNFHGIDASGIDPNLRLDVMKAVEEKNPEASFVLHGGSGTPEEDIKAAIKMGIVKININTELRVAFTETLRKFFDGNKTEIVPYKFLADSIVAVGEVAGKKMVLFGSEKQV